MDGQNIFYYPEVARESEAKMSKILEIRSRIISGESSARAEVEKSLTTAKEKEDLHTLLEILSDYALTRADEIDAKIAKLRAEASDDKELEKEIIAKVGRFVGVPYVAKDNFLTKVGHTTAASKILESFKSPIDATTIERLNEEGAILIGKVNLDAFAHGGSTENSAFGVTKNAIDPTRVAGGSSGGSAVAVAANIVPFALGSDTGGSIRQPASFNGVVGMKPTYGMISRFGVVAMASSTDVIGPITKTIEDAEILCEILAGQDGKDSTIHKNFFEIEKTTPKNLKIGLISELMSEGIDDDVRARTLDFVKLLKKQGHTVEEVKLPMAKHALAIYYIVTPAELSSNMARFDGVRYGYRAKDAKTLDEVYGMSRDRGLTTENKRRIMIGTFVLSSGYFDDYYLQAQKVRTLLIQEFDVLFKKYDFLIGPVAPTSAFKIGENIGDPLKMYLADTMTTPASMAGLPAISLPAGKSRDGLPIGVQIIGAQKSDAKLLAFAKSVEEKK